MNCSVRKKEHAKFPFEVLLDGKSHAKTRSRRLAEGVRDLIELTFLLHALGKSSVQVLQLNSDLLSIASKMKEYHDQG